MTPRIRHQFRTRLHSIGLSALFAPRKPRHPLTRVAFGLAALALLAVLLVIGVFVGAAMVIGGLLLRLVRPSQRTVPQHADAVDGDYSVVRKAPVSAPGQPLLR